MNIKHILARFFAVGLLGLCACTPEEAALLRSVTGGGPETAEEATQACDQVYGPGSDLPGGDCYVAISNVIATATEQAERLNPPQGYQVFDDCEQAVEYLFAGRWDHDRAMRVVYRESRYEPTAVSRTGAKGCAQLTGGLLNFLGGPWSDPYWNVLAMRTAVDDPDWGWCHWDIVNYCRPGGQF
jgi:hypothetical protein